MAPLRPAEPGLGNPGFHYTCVFSTEMWSSVQPFINCHRRRFSTSKDRDFGYNFQLAKIASSINLNFGLFA